MPYALPPTLSPSRVSAFTECALAFRFANLDGLPEPPAPHLTRGTLVHAALERLFVLPAPERTMAAARTCLEAAVEALRDDPDFTGLGLDADGEAAFVADARRLVEAYFGMEDPTTIHAVGLELRLRAEVGGVALTGIIDRLDRTPDGGFVVVDYKGLALPTPLPTPSGWTTMAEVTVGDEVFGADGRPTRVIAKSEVHHRPCYRLTFSDGSEVVCDNEHLWNVGEVGPAWRGDRTDKTVDADTLYEMHLRCRAEGRPRGLVIHNSEPLDLPTANLPIDPWLLGAWLGDGKSSAGSITVGQEDRDWMVEQFESLPFTAREEHSTRESTSQISLVRTQPDLCPHGHPYDGATRTRGTRRYRVCRQCRSIESKARLAGATPIYGPTWNRSLQMCLRSLDLVGNKHVPGEYLRGSRAQRLALLQGLMDTDGHWHSLRRRAVFVTTTPALAEGLRELVHSLGVSTYMFTRLQKNAVRPDTTVHHVEFRPSGFNPFRLPRKAVPVNEFLAGDNGVRQRSFLGHATRRAILDIQPIDSVPTQCIAVDSPDSLYLCGPTMVPTHNTGGAPAERFEHGRLNGVDTYALLCERVLGVLPTAVRLLYLGDGTTLTCVPTAHTTRFIEQKVGAVWVTIQRANAGDSFRPKPGRLCDWCSFQTFCPAFGGDPDEARRLGEELRAGRNNADANVAGLHDEPLRFDDAAPGAAAAAG